MGDPYANGDGKPLDLDLRYRGGRMSDMWGLGGGRMLLRQFYRFGSLLPGRERVFGSGEEPRSPDLW